MSPILPTYGALGLNQTMNRRMDEELRLALGNINSTKDELDKLDAEESLLDFIRIMWSAVEPSRPFVPGYVVEAICDHLEAVHRGEIKKLLINVPPGCMKSLTTCVFFPAWEWGPKRSPAMRYVCASYSKTLTLRDNRRCRQLIADPKYQRLWGDIYQISPDQDSKGKFENTALGWKVATSVGGTLVGERGDRVLIDDPHNIKTAESERIRESTLAWFTETVPTRVNDPDLSAFIVIMQRVHERDISGLIVAEELGYDHLCLPMEYESNHPSPSKTSLHFIDRREEEGELLWPERFSQERVDDLKKTLRSWGGGYAEAGQLQQRPAPRGGGMFKEKWWRFFETEFTGFHLGRPDDCDKGPAVPLPDSFDQVLLTCDASFKKTKDGSRVSIQLVGRKGPFRYVLDNHTDFMDFQETCDAIATFDDEEEDKLVGGMLFKWKDVYHIEYILVEDKANGPAIINTLRQKISGILPINPEGGKESRASAMVPWVRSGHILLPDGAPWLRDFIGEFATFPVAGRDDQVDALSQAIVFMLEDSDLIDIIASMGRV